MVKIVSGEKADYLNFESGSVKRGADVVVPFLLTGTPEDVFRVYEMWVEEGGKRVRKSFKEWQSGVKTRYIRPVIYDAKPVKMTISANLNQKLEQILQTVVALGKNPLEVPLEIVISRVGDKPIDVRYDIRLGKSGAAPKRSVLSSTATKQESLVLPTDAVRSIVKDALAHAKLEVNEESINYVVKSVPVHERDDENEYRRRIDSFITQEISTQVV